jgi:hypothetical protein
MKKFLTTLAVLTVVATPAFAQSFDPDNGTGNVLPFNYAPTAPHNNKIVVRRSGLNAFGMVPRTPSVSNSNDPALVGGGSLGYNEMLSHGNDY